MALTGPAPVAAQDGSQDGSADPSGQELFVEVLGCSGCHGRSGEGGMGPALAESGLTLARFVKQTRLPEDVMPPFFPLLASDEQLAIVYAWLGGADRVETPPPVRFELEGFDDVAVGNPEVVSFSARATEEAGAAPLPTDLELAYRITLLERDVTPLARQRLGVRAAGEDAWREVETDQNGRAILEPRGDRSTANALRRPTGSASELRMSLPAGRYSFVVEALDTSGAHPLVLGLGSVVLELN